MRMATQAEIPKGSSLLPYLGVLSFGWPGRIKPFADIIRVFAEKCLHVTLPAHIGKQRLFRSECLHRKPPHAFVLLAGHIRMRVWVYSGMLALTHSAFAPLCHLRLYPP